MTVRSVVCVICALGPRKKEAITEEDDAAVNIVAVAAVLMALLLHECLIRLLIGDCVIRCIIFEEKRSMEIKHGGFATTFGTMGRGRRVVA